MWKIVLYTYLNYIKNKNYRAFEEMYEELINISDMKADVVLETKESKINITVTR